MNRRLFLSLFGAAAGVIAADPEFPLWEPGKKLISIPRPRLKKIIRVPVINRMAGTCASWDDDIGLGRGAAMQVSYELREVDADFEVDENRVVLRDFIPRPQFDQRFVVFA